MIGRLMALALACLAMTGVSGALELAPAAQLLPRVSGTLIRQVATAGTDFEAVVGASAIEPETGLPKQAMLKAVAVWLSSELDLPPIDDLPRVVFASARRMSTLRHKDVPSDRWAGSTGANDHGLLFVHTDIVAIYDDVERTIYLPEGWSGRTPAELSVLVHEMVHHIQNVSGMKYECPEARERMAFAAQGQWLALFGSDLMTDFEIDPLTLLVRTSCLY
jgi:hypothetical protein